MKEERYEDLFFVILYSVLSIMLVVFVMFSLYHLGKRDGYSDGYAAGYEEGYEYGYTDAVAEMETEQTVAIETEVVTEPATVSVAYDIEYVERVVTQESGNDYDLCYAVAQCIQNACNDTLLNPEEVIEEYQYTFPASYISNNAKAACEDIFINGITYYPVGDADVMYSTASDFTSAWHENQEFVTQIGCVRFFKMK